LPWNLVSYYIRNTAFVLLYLSHFFFFFKFQFTACFSPVKHCYCAACFVSIVSVSVSVVVSSLGIITKNTCHLEILLSFLSCCSTDIHQIQLWVILVLPFIRVRFFAIVFWLLTCVAVACNFSFLGSNKTLHVLYYQPVCLYFLEVVTDKWCNCHQRSLY